MLRMDAVTLKQLRALSAVARHGSLTAAAEVLGQTPPAIHSQIKNLEIALGHPVLNRGGDGPAGVLSPQGQRMLEAAERIEAILSQAAAQVRALAGGRTGHVTLGVVSTGKYFAPRLVRQLIDLCPEIEIALKVGNREAVIAGLDRGTLELAIMGRPPREPLVRAVPLGPHPHGVILPPGHALAGRDGFDPALLVEETFITREEGSGTRILMERFIERLAEDRPVRMLEMETNETIKEAVIAGLGIAMLSLHTVCEELRSGRLVLLRGPGLPVMRHWYLVHRADEPFSPAARRLAQEIEGLNGTYLPKVPSVA